MYGCINFSCKYAFYNKHGCRFCNLTNRAKSDIECYCCNHKHQCNFCKYQTCSGGCSLKH